MVKRRTVLLGGAATAGALVIGWGVMPPRQRLHPSDPLPQTSGQAALNGWVNDLEQQVRHQAKYNDPDQERRPRNPLELVDVFESMTVTMIAMTMSITM